MPDKPNILFLMPDQLRADFLGCYGADFADTPNIDRLAEKGVRYSNTSFVDWYLKYPTILPSFGGESPGARLSGAGTAPLRFVSIITTP